MAAESERQQETDAHSGTYDFFIWMMKWGTIVAAVVAALVVWLISS